MVGNKLLGVRCQSVPEHIGGIAVHIVVAGPATQRFDGSCCHHNNQSQPK